MARQGLNRRRFVSHVMGLSGTGIAGLMPGSHALAQVGDPYEPDLVLLNGKIYTVDPLEPRAEAVAVKGGRFVAIGKSDDIKSPWPSHAGPRRQANDGRAGVHRRA